MGIREWLFGEGRREVSEEPRRRVEASRTKEPKPRYKVVDVPGTWTRRADHSLFDYAVESLPLGPLKVTLHLEPNDANPFAVAAYVGSHQVGWLGTDWSADDPYVAWMTRLDAARIRPRLDGVCRLHDVDKTTRIINFDVPSGRNEDLDAIADRLIAEHQRRA